MKSIAVFTTVASHDEARQMARTLVERKLVACAQISEIESFYGWEGAVQCEAEFRLLLKTTDTNYHAVETAIKALHSYALPAIYAIPFEHVYAPFAEWIESNASDELSDGKPGPSE